MAQKRILLFGSTGSIGESTLQVVDEHSDELTVVALAAHKNWQKLLKQV
ncbi:MAG: 1-deoxy-D-xylulose-5-phosphate reductoisomerase, partial [Planctomycetes bacterium]|nr:1-deoxy-D-xylulose-5-phosphate reductoisomerase [Planctomycetota bacterium]